MKHLDEVQKLLFLFPSIPHDYFNSAQDRKGYLRQDLEFQDSIPPKADFWVHTLTPSKLGKAT